MAAQDRLGSRAAAQGRSLVITRKPKVGGARPGAGRPPRGPGPVVRRELKLLVSEAAAHDAARGLKPWGEWVRDLIAGTIAEADGTLPRRP